MIAAFFTHHRAEIHVEVALAKFLSSHRVGESGEHSCQRPFRIAGPATVEFAVANLGRKWVNRHPRHADRISVRREGNGTPGAARREFPDDVGPARFDFAQLHVQRKFAKNLGDVFGDLRFTRVFLRGAGIPVGAHTRNPHEILQEPLDLLVVHGLRWGGSTSTPFILAALAAAMPALVSSKTRQFCGSTPTWRAASRNGSGAGLPWR